MKKILYVTVFFAWVLGANVYASSDQNKDTVMMTSDTTTSLESEAEVKSTREDSVTKTVTNNTKLDEREPEASNDWVWWLTSIMALTSLIFSLLTFSKLRKIGKMNLEQQFDNLKTFVEKELEEIKNSYNNELNAKDKKISELTQRIMNIEKLIGNDTTKSQDSTSIQAERVNQDISSSNYQTLYAKSQKDNIFHQTTSIHSNSNLYFKLSVNESTGIGEYEVTDNQESFKLIISDGYHDVASAVLEINNKSSFKSQIVTEAKGKIEKVNEGWKIIEKAKIKYC